ncbi:MAG: hypothetical protein ACFFCZ_24120 [Promethearchaeota archaeon]
MKKLVFKKGWLMQTSQKVKESGEVISTTEFTPKEWYPVDVPTTVVNGLYLSGIYDDPYRGVNLKSLPGYKSHVTSQNFESHYKPEDSPFRWSWWFRKEFKIEAALDGKQFWLQFKGINYSANIWLNGKRLAGSDYIIGSYRYYDLNITHLLNLDPSNKEKPNILALEIYSPNPDDLSISFVDWCPLPPDDNMGIWRPVFLYSTGTVALKHPFVQYKLNIETLAEAELIISVGLYNTQNENITSKIEGIIENIKFSKEILLNPFEQKTICFHPDEFSCLKINNPRIWWPYQLGTPELYVLELKVIVNNKVSDSNKITFGIRDIRSSINEHGSRIFAVNGQKILIRGAAWTPDMMLRHSKEDDEIGIAYLKNLNMNAVRLEGKLATDYFWDICDKEGMLVLAGWVCCSHWEKWKDWKPGDIIIAKESLRSQLLRLRNHPSLIAWFYGSDFPPPRPVEKVYLKVLKETYNALPKISNASAQSSDLLGKTGVKMTGPYTYVPPLYWYDEARPGFALGFNTETGPDVCIPTYESLEQMLPANQRSVGNEVWNFHAGLGAFKDTSIIEEAIEKRYGKWKDIKDFVHLAQILAYECWRAMYEAHARNFPKATGVIGWMLNSPWSSLIWQLYDYFYNPNGAFYGSKKACEPIHVQYSYDDDTIWLVNLTNQMQENLNVTVKVYNLDLEEKYSYFQEVKIDTYSTMKLTTIPKIENITSVYFIQIILKINENIIRKNLYWLSKDKDIFEKEDKWFHTPVASHGDMKALRLLERADIESSYKIFEKDQYYEVFLSLFNASNVIAFFIRAILIDDKTHQFIAPVFWDDNCVSLLPSDKIELRGIFPKKKLLGNVIIRLDGWNC